MASCSSTKASTGVRSWADVARGNVVVESSVSDRSCGKPFSLDSTSSSEVGARPWKELTERMASAFAQETDDETDTFAEDVPEQSFSNHFMEPWGVGARGNRGVLCFGEVLVMMGHYGWLMASERIDHPAALKNEGHIYVHKRDIANGVTLTAGDRVCFYLYVDEQGLGAKNCRWQGWERPPVSSTSTAAEPEQGLNPNAADFVPSMLSIPYPQMPSYSFAAPALDLMAVNLDYWTDDSDSDSSDSSEASDSGIDGDSEGVRRVQRRTKTSSRGTLSTGLSSDSESSGRRRRRKQPVMMVNVPTAPPPGLDLAKQTVGPPPGLSLQAGSIPLPPGLGFDDEAMIPFPPGLA